MICSNALGAFSRELQAGADKASKGSVAPPSQISALPSQTSSVMTVEEVIGQVRLRVYDQVVVTAAVPPEPSLTATGLPESGQGSELGSGSAGMGESGFVVRYGRDATASMTTSTGAHTEHDTTLMLSESSLGDGTDHVSVGDGSSSSDSSSSSRGGVVIEGSDVCTWSVSQQDYTELVYLCKYATTTQPPAPAILSLSNSDSGGGSSGVGSSSSDGGGGGLLQSSSVHVPQLALLVMNEPNPETAGDRPRIPAHNTLNHILSYHLSHILLISSALT